MTTEPQELEFKQQPSINTQELISILDNLTKWAKGKEELLVPVLEGLK